MRRVKCACPSSVRRTGSRLQKSIKVSGGLANSSSTTIEQHKLISFITFAVIQALVALVNDPEPDHPLRADLADEYTRDRKKFMKNAEEFTRKNSEKRPAD